MSIDRLMDKENIVYICVYVYIYIHIYIHTMEYYSVIKTSEIGSFLGMWMNLEAVIQSKVSQKEKNKYQY